MSQLQKLKHIVHIYQSHDQNADNLTMQLYCKMSLAKYTTDQN